MWPVTPGSTSYAQSAASIRSYFSTKWRNVARRHGSVLFVGAFVDAATDNGLLLYWYGTDGSSRFEYEADPKEKMETRRSHRKSPRTDLLALNGARLSLLNRCMFRQCEYRVVGIHAPCTYEVLVVAFSKIELCDGTRRQESSKKWHAPA
ncbi:Glycosyl transferase [Phytophthora palmivora]|uniref:Glycosyl transferase n=1 Tax=Phytophthora palmivora TaxID=4796 RepID=A0A2P4Y9F4_9STRA|nr:Glycosyl transferase [Phytophthora palmivora]